MNGGTDGFFLEDRPGGGVADLSLLRRLLARLRPHGGLVALAFSALLLGTACQLSGPWIVKIVIDRHVTPGIASGIPGWIALYLLALAGASLFLALQMVAVSVLGQRVILALRTEAFARLQRLPVSWFDRTPTGRLVTRLTSDVEALQELIASGLVTTAADVAVLAGTAAILLWMDARLALVTFAVMPVLLLFVELLKRSIRRVNREARRKLARLTAFLQEHVAGAAAVKACTAEERAGARFAGQNGEYAAETLRLTNLYSLYFPGVELLASVAVALLLWRGGIRVAGGAVTFGTLVAFLEYAQKFFNPLRDLGDKYNILQTALVACERIFGLLDEPPSPEYRGAVPAGPGVPPGTPPRAGGPGPASPPRGAAGEAAVAFEDVWFSYDDPGGRRAPVLRGVSFSLREGETGAIVGPTGAGKTTILSLLFRFHEPSRGRIRLFGRDIREMSPEELRGRMALVLQDPVLFSGTILSNVAAGGPDVARAVEASGVAAFAAGWERGLGTEVGERGGRLSAGQRQLVAFARALARDPRVLVLDEATSSVDPAAEAGIQAALARMTAGRTSLVVAHRLTTVLSADRIVVLHRGKVREAGTHRELLAAGGLYARLHALHFEAAP